MIETHKWSWNVGMPTHILLTKADKLKRGAAQNTLLKVRKEISDNDPEGLTSVQLFSSLKGTGLDEVYVVLNGWFQLNQQ